MESQFKEQTTKRKKVRLTNHEWVVGARVRCEDQTMAVIVLYLSEIRKAS